MSDTITCPSGLAGTVRGMKVREEKILVDRKLAKSGGQLDELLSACWEDTLEPGPYTFEGPRPEWGKVLLGDRFYALLRIRCATYGPEYAFAVTCSDARCRARIDWEIDLRELPIRTLPESSRAAFLGGNRFPTRLPDADRHITFRLLVGDDEKRLPNLRRQAADRLLSASLAYRITEIEGVEPKDKRRFVEDLSMRDAAYLASEFERVDCGIETSFEVECPSCLAVQRVELPFDADFLMPKQVPRSPTSSSTRGGKPSSSSPGTSTADPASR
ncbi:MAG: hypothetical protein ACLQVI_02545 [Polyangiaceae bacterium]